MTNFVITNGRPSTATKIGNAVSEALAKAWDFTVRWSIVAILSAVCFTLYTQNVSLNKQLVDAVAAQKVCEDKLSKALIPEQSVGEFANNRIWQPTKNAATGAYGWVSSKFSK